MIEVTTESLLSLAQVARLVPPGRNGRPTHSSTIFRWIQRGTQGVRLEAVRLGGRWLTSREALARFAAQVTAATQPAAPTPSTPARRRRRDEQTERDLEKAGF